MAAPLTANQIPVAQDLRVQLFEERLGTQFTSAYNAYWSLREGRPVTLAEGAEFDAQYRAGKIPAPSYAPTDVVMPSGATTAPQATLQIPAPNTGAASSSPEANRSAPAAVIAVNRVLTETLLPTEQARQAGTATAGKPNWLTWALLAGVAYWLFFRK